MAAVMNTARLSARQACRHAPSFASRRGFRTATCDRGAHNFIMPALSPTMSEGNIAAWRLKEGESFSAGDVLLEIETDKATMDVEAQDDGILVKIMQSDGSKGVKVGERIAVTADAEDDVASLEIPKEDAKPSSKATSKDSSAEQEKSSDKSTSKDTTETSRTQSKSSSNPASERKQPSSSGSAKKQDYPLFPSVEHLLHQNGLSAKEADSITATGPGGRLLKGDVLAYLGKISQDYPSMLSARVGKLSHLDLSNIQLAKAAAQPEKPSKAAAEPDLPAETEVAVPISLSAVIATQKRVQQSLGIFLPLSTFIARASELANEELPVSKGGKPTADDLFNAVLGLDQVARVSRGRYTPEISGISPMPPRPLAKTSRNPDIIDILASSPSSRKPAPVSPADLGISAGDNVFSVTAATGDEARATMYLERMKMALEQEPGRLVL